MKFKRRAEGAYFPYATEPGGAGRVAVAQGPKQAARRRLKFAERPSKKVSRDADGTVSSHDLFMLRWEPYQKPLQSG